MRLETERTDTKKYVLRKSQSIVGSDQPKEYMTGDSPPKITTDIEKAFMGNYSECRVFLNTWMVFNERHLPFKIVGITEVEK